MSWPYSHLQQAQQDAPPPTPLPIPPPRTTSGSSGLGLGLGPSRRTSSPRTATATATSPLSPPSSTSPLSPVPRPVLLSQRSSSSTGVPAGAGRRHPSISTGVNGAGAGGARPGMVAHRSSSSSAGGYGHGYASSSTSDLTEYERASGQSPHLPPTYARSALDRSPSGPHVSVANNGAQGLSPGGGLGQAGGPGQTIEATRGLSAAPKVPPPLYLRSSSPQGVSTKGTLKIHIPAWGVVLVRPPTHHDLESHNIPARVPCEDTVLSGAIEVIMKERRRVQAISVGVQSVCRLFMGVERGWEEDGIFERGVEIMGGDSDGIWLEKGSQSFTFSLILPATLATHDYHQFGRVSYIITARVEGVAETSRSFSSFFKGSSAGASPVLGVTSEIPYKEDFDAVIARSDKLAHDLASSHSPRHGSGAASGSTGLGLSPKLSRLSLSPEDDSALAHSPLASGLGPGLGGAGGSPGLGISGAGVVGAEASPTLNGLYHRRSSFDVVDRSGTISPAIPPLALPSTTAGDEACARSVAGGKKEERDEKHGWMKGDLVVSRGLILHANPSPTGGVNQLDVRKEGFVDGLGSWRFSATADVWSISSILLLSISFPQPAPKCTLFLVRLLLQQTYTLTSPRTPNDPPTKPEQMRTHVLYQLGRPHKNGERFPTHKVDSLWRGTQAGGIGNGNAQCVADEGQPLEEGWKVRAMARVPGHDKVRPSTHAGTITPIRVSHDLVLQAFYSIDGELVNGQPIPASSGRAAGTGPGELRMMAVKVGVMVPSCCCTVSSLDLPTYSKCATKQDIDAIIATPADKHGCMCGSTFAELGEAAMRRMQAQEAEDREREAELEREREECRRLHASAPWNQSQNQHQNQSQSQSQRDAGPAGDSSGLGLSGLGMARTGSGQGPGRASPKAEAMSRSGSLGGGGGGRPDGTG